MRVNFLPPERDPKTKEIVQFLEIRFTFEQWDTFAQLIQDAYGDNGTPDRAKVLSALKEVLTRAVASENSFHHSLKVPVDVVGNEEFRRIMNRAGKR